MQVIVDFSNNSFLKAVSKDFADFTNDVSEAIKYTDYDKCKETVLLLQEEGPSDADVMMMPVFKYGVCAGEIVENPNPFAPMCEFFADTVDECNHYIYAQKFGVEIAQKELLPDDVEEITIEELIQRSQPHLVLV